MLTLSFDVDIGGSSYNSHVVSIMRSHSICEGMATGEIELAPGASFPDTYDTVVIEELGTKVFTGFVTSVRKGRMDVEYIVEFADPTIKLADYWTDVIYESNGETAEYWIGFFCDLAGVSYQFDVSYNRVVPDNSNNDGVEWQYQSALDIIRELLIIGGYYMWSDADGIIHFSDINHGDSGETAEALSFRRERSTDPTRNKAIVFGYDDIVAVATATVPELAGREKTAVVASPYVETQAYAQMLADRMIAHFSSTADVKFIECIGMPSLRVGQLLSYEDDWMGISGKGLVVQYTSKMNNSGYTMDVVLDEFCPFIWGYDRRKGLYLSTAGSGVYFYDFNANAWEHRASGLEGDALFVRSMALNPDHYGLPDINHELFIATKSGVFTTSNGGRSWSGIALPTPETPSATLEDMDYYDLVYGNQDSNKVWVLTSNGSGVWVYGTTDGGSSWDSRGVTITTSGA
jgi:hypothetical protein